MKEFLLKHSSKGFTLVEILVVIGLIVVLASVTLVAINPSRNLAQARDTQRRNIITELANSITLYLSEEGNSLDTLGTAAGASIPTCPAVVSIGTATGNINLSSVLVEEFIGQIPTDPLSGTTGDTGFSLCQSGGGRFRITAVGEDSSFIEVTR